MIENIFALEFTMVIIVLTYMIIKLIDKLNGKKVTPKWIKRSILILVSICLSIIYVYMEWAEPYKVINSAILAPIAWSWVGKQLAKFFGIDYRKFENTIK